MTEWQILESDDFPSETIAPDDESNRLPSLRRWLLLVGGIVAVLLAVGFMALQQQRSLRRTALEEDLAAVIFEEESLRALGSQSRLDELVNSDAPERWQQAYRQSLARPASPQPLSPRLKEIEFDGRCAVVTLGLPNRQQIRAYCLQGQQWQRAPALPEQWGESGAPLTVADGLQLRYRARDKAFAQTLAQDLRRFLAELERASFLQSSANLLPAGQSQSLEIIIEPHDLQPPLIADEPQRIVVNSPWLLPAGDPPSGPAAVRLALAQALLKRTGPFDGAAQSNLPGQDYFLQAAQMVVPVHLLLSDPQRMAWLDSRQSQLGQQWLSPFSVESVSSDDPNTPRQAQAAAVLLVDTIYNNKGLSTLGIILGQMALVDGWDRLFESTLQLSTIELEAETTAQFMVTPGAVAQTEPVSLPLRARLVNVELPSGGGAHLNVELLDRPEPLRVELPKNQVQGPDGAILPAGCLPGGAWLNINGEWLENQRRLRAQQVTVPEIMPLSIRLAAAGVVAYLVVGEAPQAPDTLAAAPDSPPDRMGVFAALRKNGDLLPMTLLSSNVQLFPLPVAGGESPQFLFRVDLPACDQSWFVHYRPDQGVTGRWLGPPNPIQWIWRHDRQDILFFIPRSGGQGYNIYKSGSTLALEPVSRSFFPTVFVGWNIATGRPVSVRPWFSTTYVGLLNLEDGTITRAQSYFFPLQTPHLTPNGERLAYLANRAQPYFPPRQLSMLALLDQKDTTLLELPPDQYLAAPGWSLYTDQPALAVLSGAINQSDVQPASQLHLIWPDRPEASTVVAHAAPNEALATPVFCANGDLLYRLERQNGEYQLQRQPPGLRAQTLLTLDRKFYPVACP